MALDRRQFLQAATSTGAVLAWHGHAAAGADAPPARPKSPFLQGNFAPLREEVTADELKVVGKLPDGLEGLFVRNGPNPQFDPPGNYHWFDGDGMLHGVRLQGGQASYRNRYVRTAGWQEEKAAGKAVYGGLADPPDLKRLLTGKLPFKNTANTALVWHHDTFLALLEAGSPHQIRLPSLETVGEYTFGGKWKGPVTAHPKIDPATGELVFFFYSPFAKPHLVYGLADKAGVIQRGMSIDLPRGVMIHDFAITPRYAVFLDLPYVFSKERLFRGEPPYQFEPDRGARVGLLPRSGQAADIRWFAIQPCFVFHTLNAYEDGDAVVLLACRMQRFPGSLGMGGPTQDAKADTSYLYRWRFDRATGAVQEGPLDDLSTEFPRVPDAQIGRQARYGYTGWDKTGEFFDGLAKYDLAKGTKQLHAFGPGRFGGEGVFVPRPGGSAEDDGWLLTYVYDKAADRSELVVVDARDMEAKPAARVLLPRRVPYGFHGAWVGADQFRG